MGTDEPRLKQKLIVAASDAHVAGDPTESIAVGSVGVDIEVASSKRGGVVTEYADAGLVNSNYSELGTFVRVHSFST